MEEIIVAVILFTVSAGALAISILSFLGKGFLLNNAYLYASKKERENMDKKPHYRQTAVVFLLISLIFLVNGLGLLLGIGWTLYIVVALVLIAVIYAVASSIAIEKRKATKA